MKTKLSITIDGNTTSIEGAKPMRKVVEYVRNSIEDCTLLDGVSHIKVTESGVKQDTAIAVYYWKLVLNYKTKALVQVTQD